MGKKPKPQTTLKEEPSEYSHFLREKKGLLLLDIYVKPNSAEQGLYFEENTLFVRVESAPIEGQANKEILKLLGKSFGIPSSSLNIVKGDCGKEKVVSFDKSLGLSAKDLFVLIKKLKK